MSKKEETKDMDSLAHAHSMLREAFVLLEKEFGQAALHQVLLHVNDHFNDKADMHTKAFKKIKKHEYEMGQLLSNDEEEDEASESDESAVEEIPQPPEASKKRARSSSTVNTAGTAPATYSFLKIRTAQRTPVKVKSSKSVDPMARIPTKASAVKKENDDDAFWSSK